MELGECLPDRDFGLQMRFRRGQIGAFYGRTGEHERLLAERRRWLGDDAGRYCAVASGGERLVSEAVGLADGIGALADGVERGSFGALDAGEGCRRLGENWEPDFLLMRPDEAGVFRLVGGCVCFPSHWDLGAKMGRSMAEIHGVVPGLNEALGEQIDGFLARIRPGVSWERANWGLSRSGELNLHPSREAGRLDGSVGIDEVWWRLEEQSLVSLPESGGVLFGIRLRVEPLRVVREDGAARRGLARALRTMPEPMADYKGIAAARWRILDLLDEAKPGD